MLNPIQHEPRHRADGPPVETPLHESQQYTARHRSDRITVPPMVSLAGRVHHVVPRGSGNVAAVCGKVLGEGHTGRFPGGVAAAKARGERYCETCLTIEPTL